MNLNVLAFLDGIILLTCLEWEGTLSNSRESGLSYYHREVPAVILSGTRADWYSLRKLLRED